MDLLLKEIQLLKQEQKLHTSTLQEIRNSKLTESYTHFALGVGAGVAGTIVLVFFEGLWLASAVACIGGGVAIWYSWPIEGLWEADRE